MAKGKVYLWKGFNSFNTGILTVDNKIVGYIYPEFNPDAGPCLWYFVPSENLDNEFSVGPFSLNDDAISAVQSVLESRENK